YAGGIVERSLAPTKIGSVPAIFVTPGAFERVLLISTPEPVMSGRKFGATEGSAGWPAVSLPVPLSFPREEKPAGVPKPCFSAAATEITHGATEYGLIMSGASPSLPAANTTVMFRSCIIRVAVLMGSAASYGRSASVVPQELLQTRML